MRRGTWWLFGSAMLAVGLCAGRLFDGGFAPATAGALTADEAARLSHDLDGASHPLVAGSEGLAKVARLMGYERVVTYTLESEGGASLRAVGVKPTGPLESHEWSNPARPRKSQPVYHEPKYRWEL